MSWLPRASTNIDLQSLRPWAPPLITRNGLDLEKLSYAAVDDIDGGIIELSISAWPWADHVGRLRFDLSQQQSVGAHARTFCNFLFDCGHELLEPPEDPSRRDRAKRYLRVGDVFAVEFLADIPGFLEPPLEASVRLPVLDITAEAREVAKLAYYSAAAGVWNHADGTRNRFLQGLETT